MKRLAAIPIILALLTAGCRGMHFRVVGPASINLSSTFANVNVVIEEGGSFDSHPVTNSHDQHDEEPEKKKDEPVIEPDG